MLTPNRTRRGWIGAVSRIVPLLAVLAALGCDDPPFHAFDENTAGPFSMFGYLDLYADTQWIRVTPVRQTLLPGPDPVDAVVTLEDLESGRIVRLEHRLVPFRDSRLDAVAYTHAYWTAERLRPRGAYRVKATRSDGASSSARVLVPDEIEMTFRHDEYHPGSPETATLFVRAEALPFVDVLYLLRDRCASVYASATVPQRQRVSSGPPLFGQSIRADTLLRDCATDLQRQEVRATTAPVDWPYGATLEDFQIAAPNSRTANVEDGLGFIGGVAVWTIPFARCEVVAPRPGRTSCVFVYNSSSASVSGRVVREPCGLPYPLVEVRLLEEFADGGAVSRVWKTGERGEYRFEGIEAGSRLSLRVAGAPAMTLPASRPGTRYPVRDVAVAGGC